MTQYGIYTLANDTVYDQLVALLNSIEKNVGTEFPICVIPYNEALDKVNVELKSRPNVSLFDDFSVLKQWDDFTNEVWAAHPRANSPKHSWPSWYKGYIHRKFASFEGEFERFVFFDADSLAMKPIHDIFEKLDTVDLVFNDWEHVKREDIPEVAVEKLAAKLNLTVDEVYPQLHCDSFFGSKRGLFNAETLGRLKDFLIDEDGVQCVRDRCWWSTSALFSVMTIQEEMSLFNFTQSPIGEERTGNCADADPFVDIDGVLYNEQGLKPIHRIHYMNYPSVGFARLCKGENVDIRYADSFLNYRFLKEPEKRPKKLVEPSLPIKIARRIDKGNRKLKKLLS